MEQATDKTGDVLAVMRVDASHLRKIAQSRSDAAKTNALLNAAREIERLRAALANVSGGAK